MKKIVLLGLIFAPLLVIPPTCKASIMSRLCSSFANVLDNEETKAAAAAKSCKKNCALIQKKHDLIKAAQKKVDDSCAKNIAPDITKVRAGLDKNVQAKLRKQYNQHSKMYDGTKDLPAKDFGLTTNSNQSPVLTGKGGSVGDLKASDPNIKTTPISEFSLSGTKLSGETPGQTTTKQSPILLASASSAKSPADAVASEKTAVEAQGVAASDQPEPTVECRCYYNPEDWAGGFMSPSACEEMQKIKCCPKDQHKNAAGKCVSSDSWFTGSWFEKQKNKALHLGKGWIDNAKLLADWIAGHGEKDRHYGPDDRLTIDMQSAPGVQKAREEYQGTKIDRVVDFGVNEILSGGLNPGQQQVGGYQLTLTPNPDGTVHFRIDNDLSLWSFFYHISGIPLN